MGPIKVRQIGKEVFSGRDLGPLRGGLVECGMRGWGGGAPGVLQPGVLQPGGRMVHPLMA